MFHACGQAQFTAPAKRTIQKQPSTLSGWEDRLAAWNVRQKKNRQLPTTTTPQYSRLVSPFRDHTLLCPFDPGSFVGEALN